MSNLEREFFNNEDVPEEIKITAIAIASRGTLDIFPRGVDKNIATVMVNFPRESTVSPFTFDIGIKDSVGKHNAMTKAAEYSSETLKCIGVLNNQYNNEEVIEMCAEEFKQSRNFNDQSLKDYVPIMEKKFSKLDAALHKNDSRYSLYQESFKRFVTECKDMYSGGKKKQITTAMQA